MMLNIDVETKQPGFVRYLPFGLIILFVFVTGLLMISVECFLLILVLQKLPEPALLNLLIIPIYPTIRRNCFILNYAYPFEIAGVVLLAIIAAITLAHRPPHCVERHKILLKSTECGKTVKIV